MQTTPLASRKHIGIFGSTNAGKSALFNALLGQEAALVSSQAGTTTDPVVKGMELIPYGSVTLIDTAGLGDASLLGPERVVRTRRALRRCDLVLYAADSSNFNKDEYQAFVKEIAVPHLLVLTKGDISGNADAVSVNDAASIDRLKSKIAQALARQGEEEGSRLSGLVPPGGTVLFIMPVDSEAPKGRLILPQVQLIRDCLDNGITAVAATEKELVSTVAKLSHVDLAVTDSQVFGPVAKVLPAQIPLTSFSMILANSKSDIRIFLEGADAIRSLQDGDRVLIAESCTHNHTHEDIGRVKIPKRMQEFTGKKLEFDFCAGYDFPEDLSHYALVVHCGGCMTSRRELCSRVALTQDSGVPITNYGVTLSLFAGTLERSAQVFRPTGK